MVGDAPTFYDILEVSPDATPHEIRDAYARLKTAYSKDSLATYSLIAPDEIEGVVRQVEEAFQILSHPEKRREYDRNYHEQKRSFAFSPPPPPVDPTRRPDLFGASNIVSIDRTPPMDGSIEDLGSLMAPKTEVSVPSTDTPSPVIGGGRPVERVGMNLDGEKEWKGELLRQIRETQGISLEEMADATRISKTYITAIEEENYAKLPASVFVRGFVVQIAKRLSLAHDKVAAAYVARYRTSELCKG